MDILLTICWFYFNIEYLKSYIRTQNVVLGCAHKSVKDMAHREFKPMLCWKMTQHIAGVSNLTWNDHYNYRCYRLSSWIEATLWTVPSSPPSLLVSGFHRTWDDSHTKKRVEEADKIPRWHNQIFKFNYLMFLSSVKMYKICETLFMTISENV